MKKILNISIVVILLVALTYIIIGTFFANNSTVDSKYNGFGTTPSMRKSNTKGTDKLVVSIDKILINTHKGPYNYIKTEMSFKMNNSSDKNNLEAMMPNIRDTILRFSSSQDTGELATDKGKQQYKADLKKLIYDMYGLRIDNIYFRNFVLAK